MMKGLIFQQQERQVLEENMSNLTSQSGTEASVSSGNIRTETAATNFHHRHQQYFASPPQTPPKKKRNLPGNPDPEAEVIALSPKTLMATNRFVCEICNKGFQREQNLQLHRRGHNLPWKLKQRTNKEVVRKKVYVCPETSCVHHDSSRALGDLTGIKKHFWRKHGEKKWKCDKCSKRYAVQSDWKAHSKTCGTREYRCNCGTLFSRRDSFITHRAFCDALIEESARTITGTNPILSASAAGHSSHIQIPQFSPQEFHAFSMKKEEQNFSLGQSDQMIPPWLSIQPPPVLGAGPGPGPGPPSSSQTVDISSSSSSIFNTRLDFTQTHDHHHQDLTLHDDHHHHQNPNPNLGPTISPPYHQTTMVSPHMSATALLQKASQMGATMSSSKTSTNTGSSSSSSHALIRPHQQTPVSAAALAADHSAGNNTTTKTVPTSATTAKTIPGYGLNLSSREGLIRGLAPFGNKAADIPSASAFAAGSGDLLQEMMNSFSSGYGGNPSFDETFGGILIPEKDRTKIHSGNDMNQEIGNGGNGEELTRDFLGLRAFSQTDIMTIAGLGNCMNTEQQQQQKPWQG